MVSQADIYLKKDCLFASPLEIEYAIDNQSLLKNFLHTMRDRLIAGVCQTKAMDMDFII